MKNRINSINLELWFWRTLLGGSVVVAAGISGSFLASQIASGWQQTLGWLLAAILSLCVFGGVSLIMRGDHLGRWVILIAAPLEIIFDFHYFAVDPLHSVDVSVAVGLAPMIVAILAGAVEARRQVQTEQKHDAREEDQIRWERKQAELQAEREFKLQQLRIQEQARAAASTERSDERSDRPAYRPVDDTPDVEKQRVIILDVLRDEPDATKVTLADAANVSRTTVYRRLDELEQMGAIKPHGDGYIVNGVNLS